MGSNSKKPVFIGFHGLLANSPCCCPDEPLLSGAQTEAMAARTLENEQSLSAYPARSHEEIAGNRIVEQTSSLPPSGIEPITTTRRKLCKCRSIPTTTSQEIGRASCRE